MKRAALTFEIVVCLFAGLSLATWAGEDDDGGASGPGSNLELLEQGSTFATYQDNLSGLLVIDLGSDFLVGVSPDPTLPIKCTQGETVLRVFPLGEADGPFGPSGVHLEFEGSEGDEDDDSDEAAEFCQQLRRAFIRILLEDPQAVEAIRTIHFLGVCLTRIFPKDQYLFNLWHDVVLIQVAQQTDPTPEPPKDPCAAPCDPKLCPDGCKAPDPPPPMSEAEWIINVCDVKLDPVGCMTVKNCQAKEFEFNQTSCENECHNTYGECIMKCRGGPPREEGPKEPISPAPDPVNP